MQKPIFSCVVPVKGSRPYMSEAMSSLDAVFQGIEKEDIEIIIQDADVVPDKGQSDAFNRGFAKAHGAWLFWLNADDVLLPNTLKRVKKYICCHDKAMWIAGNLVYLNADGKIRKCAFERGWKWSYKGFPVRVYGPSSFFSRKLLDEVGAFDTSLRYMMDIDLWCQFRKAGYWYAKIPNYFWGFRIHEGSLTSGDLLGKTPEGMKKEYTLVDERYGLSRSTMKVRRLQLCRLVDGSSFRAFYDTMRFRGNDWLAMKEEDV